MNILINCSNLKKGGGIQVSHSIVHEFKKYDEHSYFVVMSGQIAEEIDEKDFPDNFSFIRYSKSFSLSRRCKFMDEVVEANNINAVFSVFGPTYWKPRVFHVCGYAKPQYIYTGSPFFRSLRLRDRMRLLIKKVIHLRDFEAADILITENEDVTAKLGNIFRKKDIYTVTNYYNQVFEQQDKWDRSLVLPDFEGVTLITIAADHPHKNIRIIPLAVSFLKANYPDFKFRFVVSAEESVFGDIDERVKKHIVFLGRVDIGQCPYLYEQADIMFLPTLLECFSASYPEAMYMKKPILTSDLDFARGLCGEAALYCDPLSPEDIGRKIVFLSGDNSLRDSLIEKGVQRLGVFDNYVERAKKCLNIILNETDHTRP